MVHLLPHFLCVPTWLKIVQHAIFGFKKNQDEIKKGVGFFFGGEERSENGELTWWKVVSFSKRRRCLAERSLATGVSILFSKNLGVSSLLV